MTVVATHVRSHQPLHPPTEVSVFIRPQQQVKMIGHQAVAGQPHRNSLVTFAHQCDESEKVVWFMEDIATPVPAIENVINESHLAMLVLFWAFNQDSPCQIETKVECPPLSERKRSTLNRHEIR